MCAIERLVLAVAVIRSFNNEGAQLSRVSLLEESGEEGGWGYLFGDLDPKEIDWERYVQFAASDTGLLYYVPTWGFLATDNSPNDDREFVTMVHPIILTGVEAEAFAAARGLMCAITENETSRFVLPLLSRLVLLESIECPSDIMTRVVNSILGAIAKRQIPPLIPWGKSELNMMPAQAGVDS